MQMAQQGPYMQQPQRPHQYPPQGRGQGGPADVRIDMPYDQRAKSAPQVNPDGDALANIPRPPPGALARKKTIKFLKLTNGNLVIQQPVPQRYLSVVKETQHEEFTTMRYTAATCDPDDFQRER